MKKELAKIDLSNDVLWTADELAATLKSTTPSIRVMTSKRVIPSEAVVRIGRKVLYSRHGIEKWLSTVRAT